MLGGERLTGPTRDNLPGELSSFVGRTQEVEDLVELLTKARLVTITGAGGAGKTRLALRVARRVLDAFPDGVWWVPLEAIESTHEVLGAIARAVGVSMGAGDGATESLAVRLAERELLLVLDSCEHLIEEVAGEVATLLAAAPAVRVLATTRETLAVDGEVSWRIPPLGTLNAATEKDDAVTLFVERAQRARASFEADESSVPTIAGVCCRLDGLPLAIELAAARCRSLSIEEIRDGLDDALALLDGLRRGAVPRQRTLEASIAWGHELLVPEEQELLRRLSVFAGGATLSDIQAIAVDEGASSTGVGVLDRLVAQSMVVLDDAGTTVRYRLLETVRQYASRRLEDAGERQAFENSHADHFLGLALAQGGRLEGEHCIRAMGRLAAEVDNLRRAARTLADCGQPRDQARLLVSTVRMWELAAPIDAIALLDAALVDLEEPSELRSESLLARSRLWGAVGDLGRSLADAQLALTETQAPALRARARFTLAMAMSFVDVEASDPFFEEAIQEARAANDPFTEANVLVGRYVGWLCFRGDMERGWALASEARSAVDRIGDPILNATHEAQLAIADGLQGRYANALSRVDKAQQTLAAVAAATAIPVDRTSRSLMIGSPIEFARAYSQLATLGPHADFERLRAVVASAEADGIPALAVFIGPLLAMHDLLVVGTAAARQSFERVGQTAAQLGARTWSGLCFAFAAECARHEGDAEAAEALLGSVDRAGPVGIFMQSRVERTRAGLAIDSGRPGDALDHVDRALELAAPHGYLWELVSALELLVTIYASTGDWIDAARLAGAVTVIRERHGLLIDLDESGPAVEAARAGAREALGDEAFDSASAEGRSLSIDDAVAYARRARGPRGRPRYGWEGLTPTELAVVEQVAAGLTNAAIGRELLMSLSTVKTHLNHVFNKLGVSNRAELTAVAVQRRADR